MDGRMTQPLIDVRLKRAPALDCPYAPAWRMLCKNPLCRGDFGLAVWDVRAGDAGTWLLHLHAGFVEYEDDHWRLGKHAARSWRHAPRRPKRVFRVDAYRDGQATIKTSNAGRGESIVHSDLRYRQWLGPGGQEFIPFRGSYHPHGIDSVNVEGPRWRDGHGRIGSAMRWIGCITSARDSQTFTCPICSAPSRIRFEQLLPLVRLTTGGGTPTPTRETPAK